MSTCTFKTSCGWPSNTLLVLLKTLREALKPLLVTKIGEKIAKMHLNEKKIKIFRSQSERFVVYLPYPLRLPKDRKWIRMPEGGKLTNMLES